MLPAHYTDTIWVGQTTFLLLPKLILDMVRQAVYNKVSHFTQEESIILMGSFSYRHKNQRIIYN